MSDPIHIQQFLDTLAAIQPHQYRMSGAREGDFGHVKWQVSEATGLLKAMILWEVSCYLARVEHLSVSLGENLPIGVKTGFRDFETDLDELVKRFLRGLDIISEQVLEGRD